MNTVFMPEAQAGMPSLHANVGGPMSRTRTQRINRSLLGRRNRVVKCPRVIKLALAFNNVWTDESELDMEALMAAVRAEELEAGSSLVLSQPEPVKQPETAWNPPRADSILLEIEADSPVEFMEKLLEAEGYSSPEELRRRVDIPDTRLVCGPWTCQGGIVHTSLSTVDEVFKVALMLGLCTDCIYDPARPVIWTNASLDRAVELYEPGSFYA
jgi:hypothetical protein